MEDEIEKIPVLIHLFHSVLVNILVLLRTETITTTEERFRQKIEGREK